MTSSDVVGVVQATSIETSLSVDHDKWLENTGVLAKVKYLATKITVEPLLGFYMMATVLSSFAVQNLNLQKACRVNLALNESTCSVVAESYQNGSDATAAATIEEIIQVPVSNMLMWKTGLQSCIPSVMVVFIGSWSDRNRKRKPCMLVPIVGEFLATIGRLLCYYSLRLPMEVTAIVETIPAGITGGTLALTLSVFSYISDVTTYKTRTLRIGLANALSTLGNPIAMALSSKLLPVIGIPGVFIVSLVLLSMCFIYGVIFVKESETRFSQVNSIIKKQKFKQSIVYHVKNFFDLQHIKNSFRDTFKTGPNNRRLKVIFIMFMILLVNGPLQGEISVFYMFTRVRFGWKEVEFCWFTAYFVVISVIGTTISVSLFSHHLRMDDALVGAIACTTKILSGYIYAFSTTESIFYLGPLVESISITSVVALRSIITKIVLPNEVGQVSAIFGICESFVSVIYCPIYTAVYSATLKSTMPGLCFLIGTLSLTPATLIFLWIYMEHIKQENTTITMENTNKSKKHTDINEDGLGSYLKLPTNEIHNNI